jgi:hypothetical protein
MGSQHEMGDEFAKQRALAMVNDFQDGLSWAEIMHEKAGHPRFRRVGDPIRYCLARE